MKGKAKQTGKEGGRTRPALNSAAQFEKLLKKVPGVVAHYSLRLYITGSTGRSTRAVANIRALCEEFLPGHYDLEVVDIYQQPDEAVDGQIIAAPTLVKKLPFPLKRMVGNLSNREKVLTDLNLKDLKTPKAA